MSELVYRFPEIRLNEDYTHLYYSEFENNNRGNESEPVIKKKTLFTEEYLKKMKAENSILIMPPNCRYLERVRSGYIVIIEEPPAMRTLDIYMNLCNEVERLENRGKTPESLGHKSFKKYLGERSPNRFTLAFPYVLFILYIDDYYQCHNGQVFLRTGQVSGFSDFLYKAPLTNISESQYVCFGDAIYKKERSLLTAVQHAIMVFWSAQFNTDYTYNYTAYRSIPVLNSYIEWEAMSKQNPMFIYDADWVLYHDNLGEAIKNIKVNNSIEKKKDTGFKTLSEMFYSPSDLDMEVKSKLKKKSSITQKLYYDICQGIYLGEQLHLNVGDEIIMRNGSTSYVDSFIGLMSGGDIRYIQFDVNGHKFLVDYNKSLKFLKEKLKEQRLAQTATLADGTVIKPEDILAINHGGSEIYKKVSYIRKSRGNPDLYEIRIANDYFMSNKLEAKVFNIECPIIDGVKVEKNKPYILAKTSARKELFKHIFYAKYIRIDINSAGNVYAKFKTSYDHIAISLSQTGRNEYDIVNLENEKEITKCFRIGRKLFIKSPLKSSKAQEKAFLKDGQILYDGDYCSILTPTTNEMEQCIQDDTFSIQGADFDLEFKIGDKVVVANWEDPLEMLNIKLISGFSIDESTNQIYFILTDKNGKITKELYTDQNSGTIFTGKIRKVTNEYNGLQAGTKIKAKETQIPMFPKKDINIIVAIIIDSPYEPLVLCSNGCTLWYSDVMTKFEHIEMNTIEWKNLKHASLNPSKIKLQPGDQIKTYNESYIVYHDGYGMKAIPTSEYTNRSIYSHNLDKYFISDSVLDCIPNPRIAISKLKSSDLKKGFLDFHGGIIENSESRFQFLVKE